MIEELNRTVPKGAENMPKRHTLPTQQTSSTEQRGDLRTTHDERRRLRKVFVTARNNTKA
jgi:hypothetical protein